MTEEEYRHALFLERMRGLQHVGALTRAWRRDLWPAPYSDPIAREERMRRLRRELAADTYWGTGRGRVVYGGVCVG